MQIRDIYLPEFDFEKERTRIMLERVPEDKLDYKPHEKSMALDRLAGHIAQLPQFVVKIAQLPSLDFATSGMEPLVMKSREQLLATFDENSKNARAALSAVTDEDWQKPWKLSANGRLIAEAPRFLIYRSMFLNHTVHHRAQLGVYLRLRGIPLPSTYGPSADDRMGF